MHLPRLGVLYIAVNENNFDNEPVSLPRFTILWDFQLKAPPLDRQRGGRYKETKAELGSGLGPLHF